MKTLTNLGFLLIAVAVDLAAVPGITHAQGGMIGGARVVGGGDTTKPAVKFDLEPVMVMNLQQEIIEILPGGVNVLTTEKNSLKNSFPTVAQEFDWRVGANSLWGVSLGEDKNISVIITAKLLQLDDRGILLDLAINEGRTKAALSSQKLLLQNYQEAIVEFATSSTGNRRLALRLLPTVKIKEPLQGYSGTIPSFGMHGPGAYLILNAKEVLATGSGSVGLDSSDEGKQYFGTIHSRLGMLVFSPKPFSGAAIKGYFQGGRMIFEWNGDAYEWLSPGGPILPEGQWAVYVWQADSTAYDKPGTSLFVCRPEELHTRVEEQIARVKMQK